MKKLLFITTLFIFCIGLTCFVGTFPDNDIWARLIAGKYIVEHFSMPIRDFLSYTPTHNWYDHEWGASVIFYIILKYFGAGGLILLKGIISALTTFFCFKTIELKEQKNAYNILYYAFMFWIVSLSLGAVVRCLIFTCLFFSIFIYILERYRIKRDKYIFFLPFLMVLWCNIHGGCISAFGLLGIYIIGEFLNKKPIKYYFYILLGCLIALFINPYGIEYVKFLFFAATMDRSVITEWFSPFHDHFIFQYMRYKFYLIFIFLIQIIYLFKNKINYERLDKTKILLIISTAFLSIVHIRHITFFVFTAGTLIYPEFYSIFNNIMGKLNLSKSLILLKEVIIYSCLLILTLPPVLAKNKKVEITNTAYPRYAIEFVKINELKGNLFISFDWGSYAAYKLYPNNLIVMDGRYEEVYNPDLLIDLKNFHLLKGDWYKIIRNYKTDVMILEKKYPVYNRILSHADWVNVFENNISGVFVTKNNKKQKYIYPTVNDEYYNKNVFK